MKTHSRSWSVITILTFAALALFVLVFTNARAAGPWYVAPGGSDGNSCLSAGSPCATINGAIGKATAGDTIKVATGIYTSTTGSEVMLLDKSATLSGGWDAAFTTQSGMSTIDGDGARRGITVSNSVTAVIERFIIQHGSAGDGGGINNFGTLTLNNCTVSGNTASEPNPWAGGIMNFGTLTLNDSIISGNTSHFGGGVENHGTVTLNNSTVSDNTSIGGGGLINIGILTLNNSSVRDNTASSSAGGISNGGTVILNNSTVSGNTSQYMGGIANEGGPDATVTLNNSTVSGNTSQDNGGGIYNIDTVILNNSTVSGNTSHTGGGIKNDAGTVTLKNSILAGNTASGTGPDCNGTISSEGYNLIGNTSGCTFNSTTGDLLNTIPQLFSGLIGSPGVHPLLPWSPAINAGNPAGCTDNLGNPLNTDQRGIARVGRCDIGAYEYDPSHDPLKYIFSPLILK